uniref:Uncharacterized protein n=1 Tax=Arion vulgaris TaxID=1028688 RepID=A0A0B7ABL6_9EUPU
MILMPIDTQYIQSPIKMHTIRMSPGAVLTRDMLMTTEISVFRTGNQKKTRTQTLTTINLIFGATIQMMVQMIDIDIGYANIGTNV